MHPWICIVERARERERERLVSAQGFSLRAPSSECVFRLESRRLNSDLFATPAITTGTPATISATTTSTAADTTHVVLHTSCLFFTKVESRHPWSSVTVSHRRIWHEHHVENVDTLPGCLDCVSMLKVMVC